MGALSGLFARVRDLKSAPRDPVAVEAERKINEAFDDLTAVPPLTVVHNPFPVVAECRIMRGDRAMYFGVASPFGRLPLDLIMVTADLRIEWHVVTFGTTSK